MPAALCIDPDGAGVRDWTFGIGAMRTQSTKHLGRKQLKWNTDGVLLDESICGGPVDLGEMFANTRPVEIEIGTGKGTFLLARGEARPELNFLGIEWAKAYCLYSADRFRRAGLTNVRMLHTDATDFFGKCLSDESVWRVHIYFPDPWPKRRHHRRRSIQLGFVDEVRRVLRPGGQLIIVTDHLGYFQHIQLVLANAKGFAPVPFPRMTDGEGEFVGTNFERKYIAQGRPFYHAALLKII